MIRLIRYDLIEGRSMGLVKTRRLAAMHPPSPSAYVKATADWRPRRIKGEDEATEEVWCEERHLACRSDLSFESCKKRCRWHEDWCDAIHPEHPEKLKVQSLQTVNLFSSP